MDEKIRQRIIKEEANRFMDNPFGQLDLSGSPDLGQPVNDKFEPDDKFGFNRVDLSGLPVTSKLKEFVTNPDAESLARVAEETGNPELIAEITDIKEEQVAKEFLKTHPAYYRTDENYQAIRDYLDEHNLPFDGPSLRKAFIALSRWR